MTQVSFGVTVAVAVFVAVGVGVLVGVGVWVTVVGVTEMAQNGSPTDGKSCNE